MILFPQPSLQKGYYMCKLKHLHAALFAAVFGTFALFSCSGDNPSGALHNQTEEYGSAVVTLPDLSTVSLNKSAALLDTNSLTLLISADNMDTMKYSWPVNNLRGQQVLINGIPSGDNRYFSGYLTNTSGSVTHSGKVSVQIVTGTTVPVHLKLSGTGSADVCIEIEGYPSSCSTEQDTVNIYNCLYVSTPDGSSKGKFNALIYGNYAISGEILLQNNYDTIYYDFVKTLSVHDSIITGSLKWRLCNAIVLNSSTGYLQRVEFAIDLSTNTIISGYLFYKEDERSDYAAKFHAVDCNENPSDTIIFKNCLSTSSLDGGMGTGELSFEYYPNIYGYVDGFIRVINSYDTLMYSFYKVMSISTDTGLYYIKSYIKSQNSERIHSIDFTVDRNTYRIKNGYIHETDSINSSIIVKLTGTDCQGEGGYDTINVIYSLLINSTNSDTGETTGLLNLLIVGNSVISGMLQFTDYIPGIEFKSINLYGKYNQGDTSAILLYGTDHNGCKYNVNMIINSFKNYSSVKKFISYSGSIQRLAGGKCSEGVLAVFRNPASN